MMIPHGPLALVYARDAAPEYTAHLARIGDNWLTLCGYTITVGVPPGGESRQWCSDDCAACERRARGGQR